MIKRTIVEREEEYSVDGKPIRITTTTTTEEETSPTDSTSKMPTDTDMTEMEETEIEIDADLMEQIVDKVIDDIWQYFAK